MTLKWSKLMALSPAYFYRFSLIYFYEIWAPWHYFDCWFDTSNAWIDSILGSCLFCNYSNWTIFWS